MGKSASARNRRLSGDCLTWVETGLGDIVVFTYSGRTTDIGFRVDVSNRLGSLASGDSFSMDFEGRINFGEVRLDDRNVQRVREWLALNRDLLRRYWRSELSTNEMLRLLLRVA